MNLDNVIAKRSNKTIYRDGDRVIKMFGKDYSKADILNEALNQARVEESELNVPKVLEVTMVDGCWAIITEYIDGKTLDALMMEDPSGRDKYIDKLVDIQMEVHAQKLPLLTNHRDKMFGKISQADFDPMTKYELQTHLNGMPRHNKVCHGDFRPSNIIITPEGKHYILDWAHVTKGNASADAARSYLVFLLKKETSEAEYYMKAFCKKSDTPRAYVERWLRIVAASQSVKGNQEEREFLSRIVNVVDFR
ncbi:MAG: aminoglycoside phosphotransferase family protein [Defluviitaleaceae bacterium]|nr:aminoglycoside phosphotransferase family protein [Defluviitaleaceae bacterium]MCL2264347.1 aminoglycoside phosphotransferase family protein [Defluviitaleaceae bacterium]